MSSAPLREGSTMSLKTDLLEQTEIFQDLSHAEVEMIGQQATLINAQAGHIFYMPDDPGEVLFTLKRGRVQLYRISPDGRKLVMAVLKPGALFGQMALIGQRLHQTFAQAIDDCVVCVMNREQVEQLLVEKPQVTFRLLDNLGQRLYEAEQRLEEFAFRRIPARLARHLLQLNDEFGQLGALEGYTHQYFADRLGTYRETVTQILNDFQSQGFIRLGRKCITILDVPGLEDAATKT
jgi:CRP-like cAMP-binding protein